MFPSGREMSTWSAVIASTRPPAIVSPMRYPATRFVSGSSRYAIGFVSRRTTPCRFGFGPPRRARVVAVAGASLRVGLKRLRLAMTLYALTGAWGTGGRPAGPLGGVTGRGRPVSGGGAQTSCWTMKARQKRPTPPSRTLRMSRRLGISLDYSRTMKEKSHRVSRRCYRSGVDALRGTQTRRLDGHTLYSASHIQIRAERQAAGRRLRHAPRQLRWWGAPAQGDRHPVRIDQAAGGVSRGRPPAGQGPASDARIAPATALWPRLRRRRLRSEEHTSELQSLAYLVCRLLLEKKKKTTLLSEAVVRVIPTTRNLFRPDSPTPCASPWSA